MKSETFPNKNMLLQYHCKYYSINLACIITTKHNYFHAVLLVQYWVHTITKPCNTTIMIHYYYYAMIFQFNILTIFYDERLLSFSPYNLMKKHRTAMQPDMIHFVFRMYFKAHSRYRSETLRGLKENWK